MKSRRQHGPQIQVPRAAVVQALALVILLALLLVPSSSPSSAGNNFRSATNSFGVDSPSSFVGNLLAGSGLSYFVARGPPRVQVNVPADLVRRGVSLVAVCMGRSSTVNKTARAWLNVKHIDEIILVDWSSHPPLEPVVRSIPGGERIKVIRVEGEKSWVLSRAYNLAVNSTSYTNVIRTDCDYAVAPDFVDAHRPLLNDSEHAAVRGDGYATRKGHYYSGNYNLARNENEVHLNGAVFIRRKDFLDIGGYDERIQTYGWDDEDLYDRLGRSGLQKRNVSYDHVSHVQHGNDGRAQTGVKFASVEIDLNSLLVSKLPKWTAKMRPSVYKVAEKGITKSPKSDKTNFISITAVSRPQSLRELVNETSYIESWDLSLGRRLHDSYGVPWDLITCLSSAHKEILLRRLMMRSETRERIARERLNAAGRQNEMVDANTIPTPRIFVCHCMHGLGNRLRALASCISFAKQTNRELVVIWEPDRHIEAKVSDLFASPLVVAEKFPLRWPFAGIEKYDFAWTRFKFHNYMEMEKQGAIKDEPINDVPDKHMYYKGAYIITSPNGALTNWDLDNENLRALQPVKEVRDRLNELAARGLGKDNIVGMHIRNRTLDKDIKDVDFIKEYGDGPTATMDMWRRKSGVHTFITEMHNLILENPSVKFFVATDTFEVIPQLEGIFGANRILSVKRTCDDRDGACVRYALVDLYALAKCRQLYGSNWSSFTEVAMRLGGQKALLAGVDFGVTKT